MGGGSGGGEGKRETVDYYGKFSQTSDKIG